MSFEQIPTPSRIATRGGLAVYGPGTDGNVTVVSNTTLTRDMYYNNLTILANAQIGANLKIEGVLASKIDGTYAISNVEEVPDTTHVAESTDGNKARKPQVQMRRKSQVRKNRASPK
jgi:hypothetical protein